MLSEKLTVHLLVHDLNRRAFEGLLSQTVMQSGAGMGKPRE
jgi:hypothetical protein